MASVCPIYGNFLAKNLQNVIGNTDFPTFHVLAINSFSTLFDF